MEKEYPMIDVAGTGQHIKDIMQRKGLTVKDIQKFLGLGSPQGIYYWFEGRNLPSLNNLYALSKLFRMPIDVILIGDRKYEDRKTPWAEYLYNDMLVEMRHRVACYYERLHYA